jgi:hypothetical protein
MKLPVIALKYRILRIVSAVSALYGELAMNMLWPKRPRRIAFYLRNAKACVS